MSIETLAFIALAALIVIIFLMVYIRDVEVNKKLLIYEKSIEELNYQNHVLNKTLTEMKAQEQTDPKALEKRILDQAKQEVQHSLLPVVASLKDVEKIMQHFRDGQSARIDRIESRTKEMSSASVVPSSSNEKMILSLFAKGKSEAEIAKDLRIGVGEVDLVLKLANLK